MGDEKKTDEVKIDWGKLATAVLSAVITAVIAYLGSRPAK
jgi:hypothetical protein